MKLPLLLLTPLLLLLGCAGPPAAGSTGGALPIAGGLHAPLAAQNPAVADSGTAQGLAQPVAVAEPLTADEAARLAVAGSDELRALERESAAAHEGTGAAGALPDPEARIALESYPLDGSGAGEEWLVGVSQGIPLGGAREGRREAAWAGARAADARRDAVSREVQRRARTLHAASLAQEEVLALLRERHALAQARIVQAHARVVAGDVTAAAWDEARVDAARIASEIEDADHARAAQVRAMTAMIGAEDAGRPLAGSLGETISLPELEEVLRGLGGLPAMREAEAMLALGAAREKVAAAERLPMLQLEAGWRERADGNGSVDLALGFTIPWSGAAGARARAASLEAAAQRSRAAQTERDLARARRRRRCRARTCRSS